jgi:pantothenate kinase type III
MTAITAKTRTTLTRRMAREPHAAMIEQIAAPKRQTKAALVSGLLLAQGGAPLEQLCQATGWQPHTCRAFLTGLRKKDKPLTRSKRGHGVSVYQLQPAKELTLFFT